MDTTNFEDYQPEDKIYTVTTSATTTLTSSSLPEPVLRRGHLIFEGFPDEIVGELGGRLPYRKLRMRVDFEVIE